MTKEEYEQIAHALRQLEDHIIESIKKHTQETIDIISDNIEVIND